METINLNTLNTLNTFYQLVHPFLDERLISTKYHRKLTSLFRTLPSTRLINLELRLDGNEQVDANVLYTKSENLILQEWVSQQRKEDPHNLADWISMWNNPNFFYNNLLKNIWLMYDHKEGKDHNLLPWIILTLGTKGFDADIIRALYEKSFEHFNSRLKSSDWDLFEQIVDKMPKGSRLAAIGLLNRNRHQLRFGISSFSNVNSVEDYLQRIQWKGDLNFIKKHYSAPINNAISSDLAFTIDEELLPIIGIECYLDRKLNFSHASEELDFLIKKGWCLPEYKDSLLNFIGKIEVPKSAIIGDRGLNMSQNEVIVEKWISHFKMVYYPNKPPSAKAYIFFKYNTI